MIKCGTYYKPFASLPITIYLNRNVHDIERNTDATDFAAIGLVQNLQKPYRGISERIKSNTNAENEQEMKKVEHW